MESPAPQPSKPPRARSSLLLGGLSGLLALVTSLPIVVPLVEQTATSEQSTALSRLNAGLVALSALPELSSDPEALGLLGAAHVTPHRTQSFQLPNHVTPPSCPQRTVFLIHGEESYLAGCQPRQDHDVVWAWVSAPKRRAAQTFIIAMGLTALVGLSTTLGILQLLAPLRRVPHALKRLAIGERDVYVQPTGLMEVDDLIDHVNTAARAMEDREDAIIGRIQVVEEIAHLVAHEVRNPLQSMAFATELIAEESDPEERRSLTNAIRSEIRSLEKVVTSLLHQQNTHTLRLARRYTSIRELLNRVVTLHAPNARARGTTLQLQTPQDIVLPIDPTLFSRALHNIVQNALSFTPATRGLIVLLLTVTQDQATIDIDDNGPGIPENLAASIFQPYVSARPGGNGLGLAFARDVVQAHGGTITNSRSALGGARFHIELPIAPEGMDFEVEEGTDAGFGR